MAQFEVPEQFVGKTLRDIQRETGAAFRSDVLGSFMGVDQNTPLTAGQSFSIDADPGSGEYQFISSNFSPGGTALAASQKKEEEGFLSALDERVAGQETLTSASERIGGDLQLPALRQSAFDLTQTLKGIPSTQGTISKQVGISAPNLQKRIASEQGKIAPVAQEAVSQQQFAEGELDERLGLLVADQAKELEPFYKAKLPLLQDRLAREQANYSQDKQNELTTILTKMSQGFQSTQGELDRANQLAMSENEYQRQIELIKLGTDEAIRQSAAIKNQSDTGTGDLTQYLGSPNQTPFSGAGTTSGNWYFTGTEWVPTR